MKGLEGVIWRLANLIIIFFAYTIVMPKEKERGVAKELQYTLKTPKPT